LHAKIVIEALNNSKNVYVEKPLAMNKKELNEVKDALNNSKGRLMVGFNRRFSPHSTNLKKFIGKEHGALVVNYRINAGELPDNHWLKDPDFGGGRIIGEGCHFIDYVRFLAGHEIKNLNALSSIEKDNKVIQIEFTDGSIGTVSYITIGDKTFPKERIEVFVDGKVGIIEDFRITSMSVCGKRKRFKTKSQDKGYEKEIELFIESITKGIESPITPEELLEVTEWTIEADRF
jgi:predicted dehydrogenase